MCPNTVNWHFSPRRQKKIAPRGRGRDHNTARERRKALLKGPDDRIRDSREDEVLLAAGKPRRILLGASEWLDSEYHPCSQQGVVSPNSPEPSPEGPVSGKNLDSA